MQQKKNCGPAAQNKIEEQKHAITNTFEKDIKQIERNILDHERNIQEVMFNRIYEKHTNTNVNITSFIT